MEEIQGKKRVGSLVNGVGILVLEWKHAAALTALEVLAGSHGLLSSAICTLLAGLTVHHQKASFYLESNYDSPDTFLEGLIHSPDMRSQASSESWSRPSI